eukprot:PhM_4_TR15665/c2_g1_i1/m.3336
MCFGGKAISFSCLSFFKSSSDFFFFFFVMVLFFSYWCFFCVGMFFSCFKKLRCLFIFFYFGCFSAHFFFVCKSSVGCFQHEQEKPLALIWGFSMNKKKRHTPVKTDTKSENRTKKEEKSANINDNYDSFSCVCLFLFYCFIFCFFLHTESFILLFLLTEKWHHRWLATCRRRRGLLPGRRRTSQRHRRAPTWGRATTALRFGQLRLLDHQADLLLVHVDAPGAVLVPGVVRCREDGHDAGVVGETQTVGLFLVRAEDKLVAEVLAELVDGDGAEGADVGAAGVRAEAVVVELGAARRGVGPQQVVHHQPEVAVVRGVALHLGEAGEVRVLEQVQAAVVAARVLRQPTVHAEDLAVDGGAERQVREDFVALGPHLHALLPSEALDALVLEAAVGVALDVAVDLGALVVAAEHHNLLGVDELQDQQVHDALEGALPAVDVVAEEQQCVAGILHHDVVKCDQRRQEVLQVDEVAVDVAEDVHGGLDGLEQALLS